MCSCENLRILHIPSASAMPEEEEESKYEADIGNLEDKALLKQTVAMLTPSLEICICRKRPFTLYKLLKSTLKLRRVLKKKK